MAFKPQQHIEREATITKGRKKAYWRRVVRRAEKNNDNVVGKMAGRLARYNWGSGIAIAPRETDINDNGRRELVDRDGRAYHAAVTD